MPKVGRKKKLLRDLDQLFIVKLSEQALEVPDPVAIQELTMDHFCKREIVKTSRYAADRTKLRKTKEWVCSILPTLRGSRFRQQLRVNQSTFKYLTRLMQGR
jgi:hypothetical protein